MTILGRIGKYELRSKIGEGTLGPMLLAEDTVLAREVAIKVIRASLPQKVRDALGARIMREARAVAALSHPNVCTLHDLGEDPQFGVYAVFEYVRGVSLRARIESGPLEVAEVAKLAREIGSALAFAHESGTLHRDLKPENVLLSRFGSQLTDFGIGNIPDIEGLESPPSRYTSPETVSRSVYTARNDQYSFACVLTECLLGKLPDAGADLVLDLEPKLASSLGPILARGLSQHPEDRFPTCRDLGDAVANAIEATQQGALPSVRLSLSSGMPSFAPEPVRTEEKTSQAPTTPAQARSQNVIIGLALVVLCALVLTRKPHEHESPDAGAAAAAVPIPTTTTSAAAKPMRAAPIAPTTKPQARDAEAERDAVPDAQAP